jgi:hypothetical protein
LKMSQRLDLAFRRTIQEGVRRRRIVVHMHRQICSQ